MALADEAGKCVRRGRAFRQYIRQLLLRCSTSDIHVLAMYWRKGMDFLSIPLRACRPRLTAAQGLGYSRASQSRASQRRASQSRASQGRASQGRASQGRASQGRASQSSKNKLTWENRGARIAPSICCRLYEQCVRSNLYRSIDAESSISMQNHPYGSIHIETSKKSM